MYYTKTLAENLIVGNRFIIINDFINQPTKDNGDILEIIEVQETSVIYNADGNTLRFKNYKCRKCEDQKETTAFLHLADSVLIIR